MDYLSRRNTPIYKGNRVTRGMNTTQPAMTVDVPERTVDAVAAGTICEISYKYITIADHLRVDHASILGSRPNSSRNEISGTHHLLRGLVEAMRS